MEFSLKEMMTLIDRVDASGLTDFSYRDADCRIRMSRGKKKISGIRKLPDEQEAVMVDRTGTDDAKSVYIESPMVGIFYAAPSEGAEPFVKAGDTVAKGSVVGIIEAMKLMNEIEAECSGTVEEVLAENGQAVEYGQRLFRLSVK